MRLDVPTKTGLLTAILFSVPGALAIMNPEWRVVGQITLAVCGLGILAIAGHHSWLWISQKRWRIPSYWGCLAVYLVSSVYIISNANNNRMSSERVGLQTFTALSDFPYLFAVQSPKGICAALGIAGSSSFHHLVFDIRSGAYQPKFDSTQISASLLDPDTYITDKKLLADSYYVNIRTDVGEFYEQIGVYQSGTDTLQKIAISRRSPYGFIKFDSSNKILLPWVSVSGCFNRAENYAVLHKAIIRGVAR